MCCLNQVNVIFSMMSQSFSLFQEFFITDFKLRYKHSILGFLWVIIKPISLFLISYTVWTALLGVKEGFALYLMAGIFFMNFVNEGTTFCMQALSNKAHIILKVRFPREIVVLSSLAVAFSNFLINTAILLGAMIWVKSSFALIPILYAIFGVALTIVFLMGVGFYLSVLSIIVHDIRHIVELSLQLLFWATPVFYKPESINDPRLLAIIGVNPFSHLLTMVRSGVIGVVSVDPQLPLIIFCIVLFTLSGYFFFTNTIAKVAEQI